MAEIIEFYECANYRGPLQAKEERGKYYWRVDCDVDEEEYKVWHEIPEYLYEAMKLYYEETMDMRDGFKEDDFDLDDEDFEEDDERIEPIRPTYRAMATSSKERNDL